MSTKADIAVMKAILAERDSQQKADATELGRRLAELNHAAEQLNRMRVEMSDEFVRLTEYRNAHASMTNRIDEVRDTAIRAESGLAGIKQETGALRERSESQGRALIGFLCALILQIIVLLFTYFTRSR